jgi:hypothetical protein
VTSFTKIIEDIRDGDLLEQCSNDFADLISAVTETRKGGAFSLMLKVRPNGERGVAISATIKTTEPKPSIGEAMFFTDGTNLLRRDPRQIDIEDELKRKREQRDEKREIGQ